MTSSGILSGPGLVFVVYPEAIATMPGSTFWSLLFFMMLLTLGLDSSVGPSDPSWGPSTLTAQTFQFGGSEAIITGLGDEFPIIRKHREIFVALLFSLYMLIGFVMCSQVRSPSSSSIPYSTLTLGLFQGGLLFVEFMSHYAASWGLLIAVFFETMVISWIYGLKRFASDIREMLGFEPGWYWRFCWAFMGPAFLLVSPFDPPPPKEPPTHPLCAFLVQPDLRLRQLPAVVRSELRLPEMDERFGLDYRILFRLGHSYRRRLQANDGSRIYT